MDTQLVIGFIGLGVMGGPMCRNIALKHKGHLIAYDMSPQATEVLEGTGAKIASSVAEVAHEADIVFLSLPGGPQVEEVCCGSGGVASTHEKTRIIVDLSTTPVSLARKLAGQLEKSGIEFADAPVARTREAAIKGELSVMVGASDALYNQILPLIRHIATDVTHAGSTGNGQVLKLVNNMLVFEHVVSLAEMMVLGKKAGVKPEVMLDAISKGSGDSFVLRNHGRKAMLLGIFPEKAFPPEYVLKDISYVLELARECGMEIQAAELAHRYYEAAMSLGLSGRYFPSVIKVVEENALSPSLSNHSAQHNSLSHLSNRCLDQR